MKLYSIWKIICGIGIGIFCVMIFIEGTELEYPIFGLFLGGGFLALILDGITDIIKDNEQRGK